MKSYILLYLESVTYKYKVYMYLWKMLRCYMWVLPIFNKYSSNSAFMDMVLGELHVTEISAVKTDKCVL